MILSFKLKNILEGGSSILKKSYNTKQREKILNYLKENKDSNVTADEILHYFSDKGENIGKATVYRYLNDLVEKNIIKRYLQEDKNCSCYQYIEENQCPPSHYHLKCEKCNKIIHLECEEFNEVKTHISKEHNFELDNRKTVLYGICKECSKK